MAFISNILYTVINGLFNLVVIRRVIQFYGSDFNGLNSTATQFITVLMIIEGGFALAANVALFKPLSDNDYNTVNGILSAVRVKFLNIGTIFLSFGMLTAVLFSSIIKSDLSFSLRFSTFGMLVISTAFNFAFSTQYRILFQSEQKEYIINFISIIFCILTNIFILVAIFFNALMLILRAIVMICAIGNSLTLIFLCKKTYPKVRFDCKPQFEKIKGTGDVFVQKLTGVIYYAAPLIMISSVVGTIQASIYAVYNTVFTLIRSVESSVLNAPRMSLGRLIAEEKSGSPKIKAVFDEYEFFGFVSISCLLSTAIVFIMPFVKIYSTNFNDASYHNWEMALMLVLICYVECIHIPSGNLINMTGKFKVGKYIQIVAGGVLLISLFVGGILQGITGILVAILFTAVALALMEIGYVQKMYFRGDVKQFFRTASINILVSILIAVCELKLQLLINDFISFFLYAGLFFIFNSIIIFITNYLFNRTVTVKAINRVTTILPKKRRR